MKASNDQVLFDKRRDHEEQMSSKQILSGIELFKLHLRMILEDTAEGMFDASQFKSLYKQKFMRPFMNNEYGLSKGKLSKLLQLKSLSDLISLDKYGTVLIVKLKDASNLHRESKESFDHKCGVAGTKDLTIGNAKQHQAGPDKLFCKENTERNQVTEQLNTQFNVVFNENNMSYPSLSDETPGIESKVLEAEDGSSIKLPCEVSKSIQSKRSERKAAKRAIKKAGLQHFRHDVVEILLNVEEKKIELSKFDDYYKKTFNCKFTREKYNIPKQRKCHKMIKKIEDVVSLELNGDDYFIKLNDGYKQVLRENEESLLLNNPAKDHSKILGTIEPEIMTCLQTAKPNPFKEESKEASTAFHHLSVEEKENIASYSFNSVREFEATTNGAQIPPIQDESADANTNLTCIERFKQEVRTILSEHGRILVSDFGNLYKNKFKKKFQGKKYKFEAKMKLKCLLEQIPDVVSLETEGRFLFMKLSNSSQEEKIQNKIIVQTQPIPKSQLDLVPSDCNESKTSMSLSAECLDEVSSVAISPQPPAKKKHKLPICTESLLSSPSPFEDSFNLAQTIQPSPSIVKYKYSTPHEVNELAKQVIKNISDEEHFVSLELVKAKMCEVMGIQSLKQKGYRNPDIDIPELKELQRLQSKLDLFARAYVMVHSIATLSELGQSMARLVEKKDFLDLRVGPLVKLPVVYDLFKAPSDGSDVHQQITTLQVLKNLNQYLTKEDKWTSRVNLKEFMEYLCDEYGCTTPYQLGVRVQSIGLGIAVLKRAQKAQSDRSKEVEQEIAADLQIEFERRCKKIKDDLLGSSHKDQRSILNKLLGTPVVDILESVFDHCSVLFKNHHTISRRSFTMVQDFLKTLVENKTLRNFFNTALHLGCKNIVEEMLEMCKEEMIETMRTEKLEKEKAIKPPKKKKLINEVKKWLNSAEDLSLSTLAQIEDRVIDQFQDFPNFVSFEYGTFLEFLTKEAELYKILEERGASLCGNAVSHREADSIGVLDFVRQCGVQVSKEALQRTLCEYYHVKEITDLGFNTFDDLKSEIDRKMSQHNPRVHYESAILCKDGLPILSIGAKPYNSAEPKMLPKAGMSGMKSPEEALVALMATPLLGDMVEYTQWTTVFEPCLGNLKQFIEEQDRRNRNDSSFNIEALEACSKALLRIDTKTTPDDFYKYVEEGDVIGTSGTLVSLVIRYGGIKATPIAMLINHIHPVLLKLVQADQVDGGSRCPCFVLHCLCRIPESLCMALADKVFLTPLGSAVGTTNVSRLLLSCCSNQQERSRLHQIGLRLGRTELIKDFEASITGQEKTNERKEKISFKDLKPVATVKPVILMEHVASNIKEPEEYLEIADDTDLLIDNQEEQAQDDDTASKSEDEDAAILPNPCKAIIDSIRKEEFGIGVVLGEEEEKLVQKQREREGRSLHRLSTELYNRDTHFVLELVQNADDNTYTDEVPALMFVVDSKRIVVLNNEAGFSEKNIRALCDVGKSTKGPHQYGYIGQKGIGFKSVFRVSDTPEVHSNGYHIRFDAKSGPSGYILPHWIDPNIKRKTADHVEFGSDQNLKKEGHSDEGEQIVDTEFDAQWMTRIVLPLKDEFHGDKKTSLSARFHDVHPSLLLFLHRLRSIVIIKDNEIHRMTREDLVNDVIQIHHSHGTDRWLVVKKQLDARDVREDVEMTELALAFPMPTNDKEATTTHIGLSPQNVFAYLPLRSYGFKFIIQGDFEVPSSREDVDADKAWNQWLREEIPKLFIEALEVFKQHPSFPGLSSVVKFFQFVPLEEEILDFFTPVSTAILKHLQGISCLPVEKTEDGNRKPSRSDIQDYEWVQPCSVVVCDDPKIRSLITPSVLRKHLNLNYLAQEVSPAINSALRTKLGVQTLCAKHLIEIGRSMLICSGPPDVEWVAHWLHCIHRSLESEHNTSLETLNEIATMDIIPLSDNTFVNLKDHAVFFPLTHEHESTKSKKKKSKASYLQELERDLSVIHSDLLSCLGQVGHSQVQKLLQRLGVKSWSPNDVIHEHILPTLKTAEWENKSEAVLRSYLVYIFDQRLADQNLCSIDELKKCCQVLTNHGPVNPSKKPVHFTPKYGNALDLLAKLPSISWTLLDDSYLDLSTNHSARREDWERFFKDLGVAHFLAVERKTIKLTKMNLDSSPWASYYKQWPETSDGVYMVEDYCSSELEEFMENLKDSRQAKIVAENLDGLWTTQYSKYADSVPVTDTSGRKLQDTLSSFILLLRTKEWLPVVSPRGSFSVPRHTFADKPQLRSLLNGHVSYADVKLEDESFVKAIDQRFTISVDDLLEHLCKWSSIARTSVGQDSGEFATSLVHMKSVYSFLDDKCKESTVAKVKIIAAFQKNPLIFVPKKETRATEVVEASTQGDFYQLKEVCWSDPSEVTLKLEKTGKYTPKRQILSKYYKESHDFLRLQLHIDLTPHTDEYIEMAAILVDENSVPTPIVLESILEIFAVLGQKCIKEQKSYANMPEVDFDEPVKDAFDTSVSNYVQKKLHQETIFPCGTKWVALADKPIVPDNKQLRKIFDQERDVHFLALEISTVKSAVRKSKNENQKKRKHIDIFLKACGIKNLSEIVEEKLTPKNVEYQCYEVQLYFHKITPCIQRYLYFRLEERYEELKTKSFAQKLSEMTFATVEKLEIVYRLKEHPDITVVQENKYGFENVGQALHFYAVRQQTTSTENLNKEITKLFTPNSVHFGNFLSMLNTKLDNGLEDFLEEQEIDSLPESEERWFIPEPEVPSEPEPEALDDSFEYLPVVRRVTHSENDGALHCWPPRSSTFGIQPSVLEINPNQQKPPELWPEPEAPDSMRNQLDELRLLSQVRTVPNQRKLETGAVNSLEQITIKVDDCGKSNQSIFLPNTFADPKQISSLDPRDSNIGSDALPKGLPQGSKDKVKLERPEDAQASLPIVPQHSTPTAAAQRVESLPVFSPAGQASSSPQIRGNVLAVYSPQMEVNFEEYEPEELQSCNERPMPLNLSLNDSSNKSEIGRWGEQFVYEYLMHQIQPDSGVVVKWMNEDENVTSPYDIEITNTDAHGNSIVTYVEVKSTRSQDKEYFEISVPELQFGLLKREAFHLYRVYNAGDANSIRIVRMKNLAFYLEKKKVQMFIVL